MTSTLIPVPHPDGYQAYLVRLWRDKPHATWRASTQCVQTGEKRVFADLDGLCAFLRAHTEAGPNLPGETD